MDCSRLVLIFLVAECRLTVINSENGHLKHGGRALVSSPVQRFNYPYMVEVEATIQVTDCDDTVNVDIVRCSGSILTPKVIVTAAHCFHAEANAYKPESNLNVEVRAGNDPTTFQKRGVRKVIVSPEYNPHVDPAEAKDDVALVILSASLEYNEEVNQIAVLSNDRVIGRELLEGTECLVLGFAPSERGTRELRATSTYLLTEKLCRLQHCHVAPKCLSRLGCEKEFLKNGLLCTSNVGMGVSACESDTGGPLVCNNQLYGVLSYRLSNRFTGCTPGVPNVYANVTIVRKVQKLLENSAELRELARFPKYKAQPNDTKAAPRQHQFIVEIRYYGSQSSWRQFTGTILSKNWILTACHCVKGDDGENIQASEVEVIAGSGPNIQRVKAKHIVTHPECKKRIVKIGKTRTVHLSIFDKNVAFIVLEKSLEFDGIHVNRTWINTPKWTEQSAERHEECQVYTYGNRYRFNAPPSETLSTTTVWPDKEENCRKRVCSITGPNHELCKEHHYICGISDDTSVCLGNTGGPVVCGVDVPPNSVSGFLEFEVPCEMRKCPIEGNADNCYDWPILFKDATWIKEWYYKIKNNSLLN